MFAFPVCPLCFSAVWVYAAQSAYIRVSKAGRGTWAQTLKTLEKLQSSWVANPGVSAAQDK